MRGIYNKIPALKNHHLHNLKHKKPIKCLREAWYIYSKKIDIFIWIVIYVLYIYIWVYIYITHSYVKNIYICDTFPTTMEYYTTIKFVLGKHLLHDKMFITEYVKKEK